jgi:hypothetical protein
MSTSTLKKLKMPTLKYRHLRGDMIETFKIINGIYDRDVTEGLLDLDQNIRTRENDKKRKKKYILQCPFLPSLY